MKICISKLDDELRRSVRELCPLTELEESDDGITVIAEHSDRLNISLSEGNIVIGYSRLCEFFRGIGYLRYIWKTKKDISEKIAADSLTYLLCDATNMDTTKKLIRYLSLMGYSCLNLSVAPKLDSQPYMGHQMGKYTKEELKELIAYGKRFGISIMPFLPTLAHMESILRWSCYAPLRDTPDALFVGKEAVYEFLDDIFANVAECLDDDYRKVHLGMDEAYNLGLGARLYDKGYEKKSKIMAEHLQRVVDICKKYKLEPVIYGDMFFRPFTDGGSYFSETVEIPEEVICSVPKEITIQFWHYYNCYGSKRYKRIFDHMFNQHMRFAKHNPVGYLASNWKCTGFVPANDYAMQACDYQAKKCLEFGVRDVTIAAWPDDGAECSNIAIMPSTFLFAERFYGCFGDISERFEDLFCMSLEDYLSLEDINRIPGADDYNAHGTLGWSKIFLYCDPMCGLYDKHIDMACKKYFEELSPRLKRCRKNPHFGYIFDTVYSLCEVLKYKATMSIEMRNAYLAGDKAALREWTLKINTIIRCVQRFVDAFHTQWLTEHQYWGIEMLDTRFGGLIQRLRTTKKLITDYIDGKIERLEAFEEPVLYADCREVIPGWKPPEMEYGFATYSDCIPWR